MANSPTPKPAAPPADPVDDQGPSAVEYMGDQQDKIERLEADNERLRVQLAAAGRPAGAVTPQHTFQLSEGDRQELEIRGVINYGGRAYTKADVEAAMAESGQRGVKIADAPAATRVDAPGVAATGPGVRGIDFVYPSVERGKIDPAVAGTPGINGPAADQK